MMVERVANAVDEALEERSDGAGAGSQGRTAWHRRPIGTLVASGRRDRADRRLQAGQVVGGVDLVCSSSVGTTSRSALPVAGLIWASTSSPWRFSSRTWTRNTSCDLTVRPNRRRRDGG